MFRRDAFESMNIHGGQHSPNQRLGQIHFHTDVAHIKEWRETFSPQNETILDKKSFQEPATDGQEFEINEKGMYTVHYDANLQDWFDFVAGAQDRRRS